MKLHRFYVSEGLPPKGVLLEKKQVTLTLPPFIHQIRNVLRLRPGEKIILFDGKDLEYLSNIVSYEGKGGVTLNIEEITRNNVVFKKEVYLFFSMVKKDNMEWILEKGTEVGVSHFIPVISARSEKKSINVERSQKIIIEAAEQSGRNKLPIIHPATRLEDVFYNFKLSFIVLEKNFPVLYGNDIKDISIGLLTGPEGGWTPKEIEMFKKEKVTLRSLGPTVLRAETAAIIASSRFC